MGINVYTEQEKILMAEKYLKYGTFRNAEAHSKWSKTTIHKVVNEFIKNGGFEDIGALKRLIETNKKEAPIRGGKASSNKTKKQKNNLQN